MRRVLPGKSPAWWAVMVCAVSAVAVFLAFEVLDLDGSDLARRLFQPLIPSQPTLAEAEEGMRHAAFDVSGGGGFRLLSVLPQSSLVHGAQSTTVPRLSAQRRPRALLRAHLRRAAFAPHEASDAPPSPGRQAL